MALLCMFLILTTTFVGVKLSVEDSFCQLCECKRWSSSVTEVSCSHLSNDFFIPAEIKKDLRKLVLSHNNFSFILKKSNVVYSALRHLELTNYSIISVEREAFRSFPRLEYLDLSDNLIRFLDSNTFVSDNFLRTLVLAGNIISLPYHRPFLHAPQILNLDLSRCNINELPSATFRNMTRLLSLNLSENSIDLFYGDEFETLEDLTELILDYNGLKLINQSTFHKNVRLKNLSLRGNYFLTLDCAGFEFLHIPSLEMLWLDGCELLSLPSYSFGNLRNLTTLSVNNNYLKTINFGDIRHLSNLKHLSVLENDVQCSCVGEYSKLCCSWDGLEVLATCNGVDWDSAKNTSCNQEFTFWDYLKPWQWKAVSSIAGGCAVMLIISILLVKGPCLRRKIDLNAIEDIYI